VSALAFMSPVATSDRAVARSPMERKAQEAGARFEVRSGWNVPVVYPGETAGLPVAWADVSHLRKFELRGEGIGRDFGKATRQGERWLCPLTTSRALVIGGNEAPGDGIDVTTCFAALTILGPEAREVIARFCALDLRPHKAPPHSFRPGSIARQPGMILVEAENRFLLLFGWAVAEYMWTVIEDAAKPFGGLPIGAETLARVSEVPASA
jgi:glycine cleavage system aminomethyltransferase T